ncbi:relaxase domain-containing protein [Microbacteriaceae bacterium VKM Ac-2854]|nr:relaxase domain-containing protein [Microbacteriaceae bacterium VKM Ac-2854]
MMTLHKLTAGDGYTYYTSEVATADVRRDTERELGDYYTADGNPAGVWMGAGLAGLGEIVTGRDAEGRPIFAADAARSVHGEVTEAQMKALYGEGLHPNADALLDAGAKHPAVKLGASYYRYDVKEDGLGAQIRDGYEAFTRINHREPNAEERRRIRVREGAIAFRDAKGREPVDKEELGRFITAASRPQQQAVAGYDLVFSPSKSVSVLWALGDDDTRQQIEQAHESAIAAAVEYLEETAITTRTGRDGVAQEDVRGGLVASRFRHYDSRTGDPQLHDHLVVSNKVQGVDGRWRAIDGALLHKQAVAASEFYNQHVMAAIRDRLGVAVQARTVVEGRRPVMEIAGIDTELMTAFSSRSASIRDTTKRLEKEYRRQHGHEPDAATRVKIAQQATLETRPAKEHARSLEALREDWRGQAVAVSGLGAVDGILAIARAAADEISADRTPSRIRLEDVAAAVLESVSEHHTTWGAHTVEAEARRWVQYHHANDLVDEATIRAIADLAIRDSIALTPASPHATFAPLTRRDGTSIYEHRGRAVFTSRRILDAEDTLLDAARHIGTRTVSAENFDAALAEHGTGMDAAQARLAHAFATSERRLLIGVGPAGAGKTTALRVAARAVENAGGRMIGLAPSAAAAGVLGESLNIETSTIHRFLLTGTVREGDVIVVDEAGMAGTDRLAQVVRIAAERGAVVRFIGDDRQLGAVEAGGALRLIQREVGAVELEDVYRFQLRNPDGTTTLNQAEADASLQLRNADPDVRPFDWYQAEGRVTVGSADAMVDAVYAAWQADIDAGETSLMIADDNATVADLSARAQAYRIATGQVTGRRAAPLRDGLSAHTGDVIVTRKNNGDLRYNKGRDRVLNNDVWTVLRVNRDGSVLAEHAGNGGRITLPQTYLAAHTQLGYASTVHRSQGMTVDTAHSLASASTKREHAYVGLTRGRFQNKLYVAVDPGDHVDDVLQQIAGNVDRTLSATETIRAEQTRIGSLELALAEYADVAERADDVRFEAVASDVIGTVATDQLRDSTGWASMRTALQDAERVGISPERALSNAWNDGDLGDTPPENPAAFLAARIRNNTARTDTLPTDRALAGMGLAALQRALDRARTDRENAERALAAHSPATDTERAQRTYGHLTDAAIADRVAQRRADMRNPELYQDRDLIRARAREILALREETRAREQLPASDRIRENLARGPRSQRPAAYTPGTDQDPAALTDRVWRARVLENKLAAETRLRRFEPDQQPAPKSTSAVPDWIAPAAGLTDSRLPEEWRQHLAQRHQDIALQLEQQRAHTATEPPAWTREHLPMPDAGPRVQRVWSRLVVDVETYRSLHTIPASETTPIPERHAAADPVAARLRDRLQNDGAVYRTHQGAPVPSPSFARAQRPAVQLAAGPDPLLRLAVATRGDEQVRRTTLAHRQQDARGLTETQRQEENRAALRPNESAPGMLPDPTRLREEPNPLEQQRAMRL